MRALTEGAPAPDFTASTDTSGTPMRLSELRGQAVVVYFYPKDDTTGCTAEAKDFSSHLDVFTAAGAALVGISPDTAASHAKFRKKHALTITLVADEDKSIAEAYGVWVEKTMYGRKFMGVERATFLIDANGRIARIWRNVRVPGHADEVLLAVKAL